jgi:coproporphyrinogen III oxidase
MLKKKNASVAEQQVSYLFKDRWIAFIQELQNRICAQLEAHESEGRFISDRWEREGGGGGDTRILNNGDVIEKGGVNTSTVFGKVTDNMRRQLNMDGDAWFACGLSLVIHPRNPYVPTVHANWRYFELYDTNNQLLDSWFGGGTDLTPYYLFEEDVKHFHQSLRHAIDPFGGDLYPLYKKECDTYFTNTHRGNEMRGVGGVFYDQLKSANSEDTERLFRFQQANAAAFLTAFLPIITRRKNMQYGQRQVDWQETRRGRYVEFNLIHDRGTLFGLKTQGRTESILMSLPPRARWIYDHRPEPGSPEDQLLQVCLHPREWV